MSQFAFPMFQILTGFFWLPGPFTGLINLFQTKLDSQPFVQTVFGQTTYCMVVNERGNSPLHQEMRKHAPWLTQYLLLLMEEILYPLGCIAGFFPSTVGLWRLPFLWLRFWRLLSLSLWSSGAPGCWRSYLDLFGWVEDDLGWLGLVVVCFFGGVVRYCVPFFLKLVAAQFSFVIKLLCLTCARYGCMATDDMLGQPLPASDRL